MGWHLDYWAELLPTSVSFGRIGHVGRVVVVVLFFHGLSWPWSSLCFASGWGHCFDGWGEVFAHATSHEMWSMRFAESDSRLQKDDAARSCSISSIGTPFAFARARSRQTLFCWQPLRCIQGQKPCQSQNVSRRANRCGSVIRQSQHPRRHRWPV